jgi:dTDP-4-dehydrorhamnose 3,5-epimerase
MKFEETCLKGAWLIDLDPVEDDRGFFARAFCQQEFAGHGLKPEVVQSNLSYNAQKGTLRGLHYQLPPAAEAKFIRCISGAIYDVIVDMRPDSPTYLQHVGVELSASNRQALYIPEMFAHGYQALADNAEVLYQVSEFYTPGVERGLRYDDPRLAIEWPAAVTVISDKDRDWPMLDENNTGAGQ